jgi:hypothetical protein
MRRYRPTAGPSRGYDAQVKRDAARDPGCGRAQSRLPGLRRLRRRGGGACSLLVRDDEHVVQEAPADGGVGGVEDRAGTGELDTELLEARAGDDLERVSRLVFIGVRKDFLDETALYGGESAYPRNSW